MVGVLDHEETPVGGDVIPGRWISSWRPLDLQRRDYARLSASPVIGSERTRTPVAL